MIVTKLRLKEQHPMTGPSGTWPLPFVDLNLDKSAGENGYMFKGSTGLEPPQLVSVVEGFDKDGIPILGSIAEKRVIVLRIGLYPKLGQSNGMLREYLYNLISRKVIVSLMNDTLPIAQTMGFIRSAEASHFTNSPEIQITVECEDGEFSSPNPVDIPLVTLTDVTDPVIDYEDGSAPTGLDLNFTVTADTPSFMISGHAKFWTPGNTEADNEFIVDYGFEVDDIVTISTQPRNKRITLLRSAITYDLAGWINPGAVWPKLYSGVNTFTWDFDTDWMTWNSASYIPKYWGV